MSDMSQGPGWWQASDGKWYPPEAARGAPADGPRAGGTPSVPGSHAPGSSSGPGRPTPDGNKALIKSLYDFKFDYFVTPKVLRFFYAVAVILLSLSAVIFLIGSLTQGSEGIAVGIIVTPIAYFVSLVMLRIYFELIAALFRIADDLRAIRRGKGY